MRRESLVQTFWNPVSIVVVVYLTLWGLRFLAVFSLGDWLDEWLKWLQILVMVTFAINYGSERRWEWLLFCLTTAAVANAISGIYEFFGGSGALHLLINDRFRAFGTFGQPNPFGGFMGLVAPITLMAAFGYGKHVWENGECRINASYRGIICFLSLFYGSATILILIGIGMS